MAIIKWFKGNNIKWGFVLIGLPPLWYGYVLGSDMSIPICIISGIVWVVGILLGKHLVYSAMKDTVAR